MGNTTQQEQLLLELFNQSEPKEIQPNIRIHYIIYLCQQEHNLSTFHYTDSPEYGTNSTQIQDMIQKLCHMDHIKRTQTTQNVAYAITEEGQEYLDTLQSQNPLHAEVIETLSYLTDLWVDSSMQRLIEHTEYHYPEYVRHPDMDWF